MCFHSWVDVVYINRFSCSIAADKSFNKLVAIGGIFIVDWHLIPSETSLETMTVYLNVSIMQEAGGRQAGDRREGGREGILICHLTADC